MYYVYWVKFCTKKKPSTLCSGNILDKGGRAQVFHISRRHLTTLSARRVTRNKIYMKDPQIQCDSFGTRPKKMRISQRLFIRF